MLPHSPAGNGHARRDLLARPFAQAVAVQPEVLLVDVPEAARRLGVSARTVQRLVTAGSLPIVKIARRTLISTRALAEWVQDHECRVQ